FFDHSALQALFSVRHQHHTHSHAEAVEVVVTVIVAFSSRKIILTGNGCSPFSAIGKQYTDLRPAKESPRLIVFGVNIIVLKITVQSGADPQPHKRHDTRRGER